MIPDYKTKISALNLKAEEIVSRSEDQKAKINALLDALDNASDDEAIDICNKMSTSLNAFLASVDKDAEDFHKLTKK